ncbi:MFS transporter [Paracoccus aestuariivivens]|uniref:MFS transporter n=1 Tax=Paracoccus aestuariivivens TaxID=1820333 RepID=A0A6L6JAV7_9RHOB|nr:MFS transporter [Paracoccus aestuariivivens]MTH77101.1 MFS transporter [Paracoccus aestuariivivens]
MQEFSKVVNQSRQSAWSPFRHSAFTLLWTATLISNIGTWMNDVGAGWLMTELSPSPGMVSLVSATTTVPIFLFVLLAGALADRVNKRRYLIIVNTVLGIVIALLAFATLSGKMTPGVLLVFTFLIGTGAAFIAPAWQSVVPALVPQDTLSPAVALNSLGVNISRAIGPALAGLLITVVGLSAPFFVNAISSIVIIGALILWKPPPEEPPRLPPEPIAGAMLTGFRHAMHNAALKATLLRALGFFSFASAYWALLPLFARGIPGGGAALYGLLLGAIGAGAVTGALILPGLRRRMGINGLTTGGTITTALAMAILSMSHNPTLTVIASFIGGLGWIAVLTSLNVSAQIALPNWVRARGLSIALMVFYGCMAAGSTFWGQIASLTSVHFALLLAAAGLVAAIPLTWHALLGQGQGHDMSPATSWPSPEMAEDLASSNDRGPVLVTITYEVDSEETEAFLAAMTGLSGERYRDGAHDWGIYQDAASPRLWIEWFFLHSWAEHLRQHERHTKHDVLDHARAHAFHRGIRPPEIRHYLAPRNSRTGAPVPPKGPKA